MDTPTLALARNLDLSYPSNQLAAGGAVAGLVLARLTGQSWADAVRCGAGAFAAWAGARELDPDHAESAALALAAELLTGLAAGGSESDLAALEELAAAFAAVGSLRLLSATVGVAPTQPEQTALAAGALGLSAVGQQAAALLPGTALLVSHTREDGLGPGSPWTGVAALAAVVMPTLLKPQEGTTPLSGLLALAALSTAPASLRVNEIETLNDIEEQPISRQRVKSSRMLALGAVGLSLIVGGQRGLRPVAAACAGVGAWALLYR
ncbi:hypothetical protein [Deinococcus radiophilus]|uniref:Uncharacterized protein n=2 Tax=Deinococcus radiophilus TaxID=32062 RepID=A0A3S0JMX5_9DEIO|nr:hypothetical protein [Deinococcus radiophilus]RTR25367.1 hypothetical protein EJ104_11125 [Deinococcus radiophilus]UFA51655.1 hypothetical protein LMT64_11290 [Deinococcus radiophilus]